MSFLKKSATILLSALMLTMTLQSTIHAEESGVNIKVRRNDGITISGIWGPSRYDSTKTKITFTWNINTIRSLNRKYGSNTVLEVEPDLIPYVARIDVVKNMGHGTKPQGQFSLLESSPGVFVTPTINAMNCGSCPWTHTAQATIVLKVPVSYLPKDKYVYSVKLTDPKQDDQYVLKTRVQGAIEKKPNQYSMLNYGVFKSMFGFNVGRPLSSDTQLNLRYAVEYIMRSYKDSTFEFRFDKALVDHIDYVEIYDRTGKLVLNTDVPASGIVGIECRNVYPRISFYQAHPIDVKVYLKNGMTIGDLPEETYTITALSSETSSNGRDIHQGSLCTLAFKTNIDY